MKLDQRIRMVDMLVEDITLQEVPDLINKIRVGEVRSVHLAINPLVPVLRIMLMVGIKVGNRSEKNRRMGLRVVRVEYRWISALFSPVFCVRTYGHCLRMSL